MGVVDLWRWLDREALLYIIISVSHAQGFTKNRQIGKICQAVGSGENVIRPQLSLLTVL